VSEPTGSRQRAARSRLGRAWITMAALAAIAAAISYSDGLFLVREAGAVGRVDYLYPLLPDGLIVICLTDLYTAAAARVARPRWATAGVVLGAVLTVAMNLAAGLARSLLLACVDGLVPVMFFVAAEVLNGHIRRGRGGASAAPAPATSGHCAHTVALTREEAVRVAYEHARDCLDEPVSIRQLSASFKMHRDKVAELARPERGQGASPPVGALAAQPPAGPSPVRPGQVTSVNGDGHG
jgi:hypothetical protein